MNHYPTNIELVDETKLRITWDDGLTTEYAVSAQPTHELPVLSASEAQPTRIAAMKPVGNYAYAIHFNDGHDTGIFTLEFLRNFAEASN